MSRSNSSNTNNQSITSPTFRCLIVSENFESHVTWLDHLVYKEWKVDTIAFFVDSSEWLSHHAVDVVLGNFEKPWKINQGFSKESPLLFLKERFPEISYVHIQEEQSTSFAIQFLQDGGKALFDFEWDDKMLFKLENYALQSRQLQDNLFLMEQLRIKNQQLEFQNRVISSLYELGSSTTNQHLGEFLEEMGSKIFSLLKIVGLRIRLSGVQVQKEFGIGIELPWKGSIPEREIEKIRSIVFLKPSKLKSQFPNMNLENVSFYGLPLVDVQQNYLGVIGYYIAQERMVEWSEELFALVTKKLSLMLATKMAETDNQQSYATLLDLATFNIEMLSDFRTNTNQELEHYRQTLNQILSKDEDDLRPKQALILRKDKIGNVRIAPFHRNERGKVVVMAPTLSLPALVNLFPFKREGVAVNISQNAFQTGVFTSFPFQIIELLGPIRNYVYCPIHFVQGEIDTLVLFNYGRAVSQKDAAILVAFSVPLSFQISFSRESRDRHQTQILTMSKLAELAEKRDDETGAHLKRIAHYCRVLAEDLAAGYSPYSENIDAEFIRTIYESSPLHDIGKVGIEDSVLCKPGKLTDAEYDIMKTHTLIGAQVLEGVPFLQMAHEIALCHHEKFDGTGYPNKLHNKEIPLAARIVSLADVYDAITSQRVYRPKPFTHEEAKALILREYGKHFDPAVVDAFLRCEQLFTSIREKYNPPSVLPTPLPEEANN